MIKKTLPILLALAFSENTYAFESGQLSLDTPNVLKKGEGSFGIRHRFFGEATDYEKFLGSDDGGNMHFLLKYAPFDNLAIGVDHSRSESAYGIGIEYAKNLKWLNTGVRFNGFRLNKGLKNIHQSYMINTSLQTPNYFNHINFSANIGYDAYYQHKIFGVGIDLNANNFLPFLVYTQKISLLAEFFPQVDKIEGVSGKFDAFSIGIKYQTFGHHFELLLSNSTNMDARTMSLGTNSDNIHFGFNINRKF